MERRISVGGWMLAFLGVISGCRYHVELVDPTGARDSVAASVVSSGFPARSARIRYDPRIESRYNNLLDTLVALMGHAPSEIRPRSVTDARGETIGSRIVITRPDDEDALFHELGHFWSMKEPHISCAAADSLKFDPSSRTGAEQLANLYAGVLRARTNRATPTNDVSVLFRLLERGQREEPCLIQSTRALRVSREP